MHRSKIFLLLVSLSACTAQDSRYKDTAMLERPPVINAVKVDEVKIKDTSLVKAEIDGTGLGTLVILKTTTPPVMVIKQPYDVAWQTLGNALKADNLEITDREHDDDDAWGRSSYSSRAFSRADGCARRYRGDYTVIYAANTASGRAYARDV